MECFCHLRNVQDKSADSKSPYERRCDTTFEGPTVHLGLKIVCNPTSTADKSRLHQFGAQMLLGNFIGYTNSQRGWTRGLIRHRGLAPHRGRRCVRCSRQEIQVQRGRNQQTCTSIHIYISLRRWFHEDKKATHNVTLYATRESGSWTRRSFLSTLGEARCEFSDADRDAMETRGRCLERVWRV